MKKRRVRQIEVGSARLCFDYGDVLLDLLLPIICIGFLRKCNSHAKSDPQLKAGGDEDYQPIRKALHEAEAEIFLIEPLI